MDVLNIANVHDIVTELNRNYLFQEDYTNHDSILFVIDASPAMLEPQDNGEIPLQSAFRAVRSVLLSKAFGSASDSVGVLLYGTVSDAIELSPPLHKPWLIYNVET
jgi:hypothetical protein